MPTSLMLVSLRFLLLSVTVPIDPLNAPMALIVSVDSKISCTSAGYLGTAEPNTYDSIDVRVELAGSRTNALTAPPFLPTPDQSLIVPVYIFATWSLVRLVIGFNRLPALTPPAQPSRPS